MLNVLPEIDSPRAPLIFNTQTLTPKLKPAKLSAVGDADEESPALKPKQEESTKKRVDEEYRNAKYVYEKSIAGKRHLSRVEGLAKERSERSFFRANGGHDGEERQGGATKVEKGGQPNWEATARWRQKDEAQKRTHAPAPKRGHAPSKFSGGGGHFAKVEESEVILDRLYRPNTCMAQDPEEGRMAESTELAQGGSAMIEKAKSIGWKDAKLLFRDTIWGSPAQLL